ncbi:MAG TPA: ATP-binding cassette domain-containing protein [Epsilonproteobacteria bacterium]|nr:ATP-binding cassette domain-containing protein [Campylobacterota bacterium]
MSHPLLEANNISHSFDTLLFSNVNLSLSSSQSASIVGRSGSGKSTLLHIFSTFIKPDEGSVKLFGKELYTQSDAAIEALRRYDIGIIFQFHYLFKGMTAMDNIDVASMLSEEAIDEAILEKLEIKELMHQRIGDLSGGQQQRVSIARVLSKKPRIIYADEPTGNLDKETADLVMDVLLDYTKETGAGLLLVTHDINMARRCDHIYKLEDKVLKEEV